MMEAEPLVIAPDSVRRLVLGDLVDVLAIEHEVFTDPWSDECFAWLISSTDTTWGLFVDEDLAGYTVAIRDSEVVHLANIAVAKRYQRNGVADRMLHKLTEFACYDGAEAIELEVRASNYNAINFYFKHNFVQNGVLRNYYKDGEDALTFRLDL